MRAPTLRPVPEFLSRAWLTQLEAALDASPTVAALAPLVIEQVVTRVPGQGEVRYRISLAAGRARVIAGDDADGATPDVRLTTDYETAVAIATGEQNAQIALAHGRLRLGGNVELLVRRAEGFAALDDATAALRAVTTYRSP